MNIFITKETINRLLRDVKEIIKNPLNDNGIYYIHDDTDILKGYALIIGPSDTPYFGGFYFFEFNYPKDYPYSPPIVKYHTNNNNIRFNPNLYTCGKVCVSILNTWHGDQWSSCQTISSVLLTLCTLFCKNPLLNEPGVQLSHTDLYKYNSIIEYSNINIAICDIINKAVYKDYFDGFYHIIKEIFEKNYQTILDFITEKNNTYEPTITITNVYQLYVNLDYNTLLKKYKKCKLQFND